MKQIWLRIMWRWLPKRVLSRWIGKLCRQHWSRRLIPYYVRCFDIDMNPVKRSVDEFEHLLAFFIRELRPETRPIAEGDDVVVSPVDGTISQIGMIEEGMLFQAKGITYSLEELLGKRHEHVSSFLGGCFMTIYLSPRDYHRIHMPLDGNVVACTHIPGNLYPVNKFGVNYITGLFVTNERLVSYIDSRCCGNIALVKVGATNVGSIKVGYDKNITTNQKVKKVMHQVYDPAFNLQKGDELGWFEFGSTVILLFEPGQIEWMNTCVPGTKLHMGQVVARILNKGRGGNCNRDKNIG